MFFRYRGVSVVRATQAAAGWSGRSPARSAAVAALACMLGATHARADEAKPAPAAPLPFQNTALPIEKRVADLIGRMTLAEKIAEMRNTAPGIARLGVPPYEWWNECLHGVGRAGTATVFPQAIGLGATWDKGLLRRVADAISDEARAKHHEALRAGQHIRYHGLTYWSPNINLFRDPRWGRGQETYGEDPYLTSRLGVAFVKGLQGDDPHYLKLVATPKHYAVHSGPEPERHSFDARVSERDLRETYLPAFEATVREGGAYSVMCAYNRVDGQPACASDTLLGRILRKEWRFPGYVVSDCGAIRDFVFGHRVAKTADAASATAVKAGCDLECGDEYVTLGQAVIDGLISEREIDVALTRLFTARFKLGMFDPPEKVTYAQIPTSVIASDEHRRLALDAARESIVLLKNDGVLPLKKDVRSIAVVGPTANLTSALLGNYNGLPRRAVTPLTGIREKVGPAVSVTAVPSDGLTDVEMAAIPTSALFAAGENRPGLFCEYFANKEFSGQPVAARLERQVDNGWMEGPRLAPLGPDGYALRATGSLVPSVSGKHWIGFLGGGRTRLYLDDKLLFETDAAPLTLQGPTSPGPREARLLAAPIELEAGRAYALKVEHVADATLARASLVWLPPQSDVAITEAADAAGKADVIVACVGIAPTLEGEELAITAIEGFRGGDRTDIALPKSQQRLLEALGATGKPLVVVLLSGSAVALPWADAHAGAVLAAWYPGEAGGAALADVLFGAYNPSGRLPVTFYRSTEQLPPFEDYSMRGRTYRFFTGAPLYPFGHGLSYTRFAYKNLTVAPAKIAAGQNVRVSADVTNVGALAGDEVAELYLSDVEASVPVALRALQGFERVRLAPGETRRVSFTLTPRQMAVITDAGQRVVEPGAFKVAVGGKQPGQSGAADAATTSVVEGQFVVTGKPTVAQ